MGCIWGPSAADLAASPSQDTLLVKPGLLIGRVLLTYHAVYRPQYGVDKVRQTQRPVDGGAVTLP